MSIYLPILTKLAIGLVALIIQINVMGKGNLAPTNAFKIMFWVVLLAQLFTQTPSQFFNLQLY